MDTGAGRIATTKSQIWAGIDSLNFGASVTTDSGITLSVSEDIGGGDLADYADKEINDLNAATWVIQGSQSHFGDRNERPCSITIEETPKMQLMTFMTTIAWRHRCFYIAWWSKRFG